MIWDQLTTVELAALDRRCVAVLPLAATEQHGPHLPLATDRLIAEGICRGLNEEIAGKVLILPCPPVGYSAHHRGFVGTLTVSHATLMDYARGIAESVFSDGFSSLLILNAHGGNIALGGVLQESLGEKYPCKNLGFCSWWQAANTELLDISESGKGGAGHACELETSLMLHLHPEIVRTDRIQSGTNRPTWPWAESDMLRGAKVRLQRSMEQMTQNGVYGDPTIADASKGERIMKVVIKNLKTVVEDFFSK